MKRWPLHKTYFWETAPFFRILLPVIGGILFYSCSSRDMFAVSAPYLFFTIILISFVALTILELLRTSNRYSGFVRFLLFNIILLLGTWSLCWYNDIRNDPSWFGNEKNGKTGSSFIAKITGDPAEKEKVWKLPVTILYTQLDNEIKTSTGEAFVYVYKYNRSFPFAKGDTIIVPDKWKPIENQGNPFEFDYSAYCARNNLYYQQFIAPNKIKLWGKTSGHDKTIIETSHDWCMAQLEKYIPDPTAKGLIQAMILGDVTNLDEHLLVAYSETGIVHIIAISGGNVTIFFSVICFLLWWLRNKKHLWIKYIIALPLVWFYIFMAGAPPSAVRAAIMFSILAIGFALQKNSNSLNQLFATAVILLLAQPMWLYSLGFQLSFIAVLSLILFYKPVYNLLAPVHKMSKALWSTASASIAAEMLVAPMIIYYFHLFPLLFIFANIAAFLFMTIVLILGIAVIALFFVPALAKIVGILTAWLIIYFNDLVYRLQDLNPASFHYLRLSSLELILFYICLAGISTFILRKIKPALFTGLATACLLLFSFCSDEWTALHQKRIVVYNINKINHIELIEGKYYSILNTSDSVAENKKAYTLKPAHTSWMAWKGKDRPARDIFLIGDRTVLLLDSTAYLEDSFHVDYVIIKWPTKRMKPQKIRDVFSPRTIVLGNTNNRRLIDKWYEKCKEKNIPLHTTTYDRAFVLE